MRHCVTILLTAAWVCGCVEIRPIQSLDTTQISDKAEVARDNSEKSTEVEGLKLVFGEFKENHYLLKATRSDGAPVVHYAFFMQTLRKISLGGLGWTNAVDEQGRKFALIKQAKQTNEDILYESVTFELTREWLDWAATHETKIRVFCAITNQVIVFPTNYVAGFLSRMDQEFLLRN